MFNFSVQNLPCITSDIVTKVPRESKQVSPPLCLWIQISSVSLIAFKIEDRAVNTVDLHDYMTFRIVFGHGYLQNAYLGFFNFMTSAQVNFDRPLYVTLWGNMFPLVIF